MNLQEEMLIDIKILDLLRSNSIDLCSKGEYKTQFFYEYVKYEEKLICHNKIDKYIQGVTIQNDCICDSVQNNILRILKKLGCKIDYSRLKSKKTLYKEMEKFFTK